MTIAPSVPEPTEDESLEYLPEHPSAGDSFDRRAIDHAEVTGDGARVFVVGGFGGPKESVGAAEAQRLLDSIQKAMKIAVESVGASWEQDWLLDRNVKADVKPGRVRRTRR